jgi:hypothetical protein
MSSDSVISQVKDLVVTCCSNEPRNRPPAEKVAHTLLEILTAAVLPVDLPQSITEEAHDRIQTLVDKVEKPMSSPNPLEALSNDDIRMLRKLTDSGDVTAAFLLGSGIWYGLVDPTNVDQGQQTQILVVAEMDRMLEARCRTAIGPLEFALMGGKKEASGLLALVYQELARLCHKQAKQHKVLVAQN